MSREPRSFASYALSAAVAFMFVLCPLSPALCFSDCSYAETETAESGAMPELTRQQALGVLDMLFSTLIGTVGEFFPQDSSPGENSVYIHDDETLSITSQNECRGCDIVLEDGSSIDFAPGSSLLLDGSADGSEDGASLFIYTKRHEVSPNNYVREGVHFSDDTRVVLKDGGALYLDGIVIFRAHQGETFVIESDAFDICFEYYYDIVNDVYPSDGGQDNIRLIAYLDILGGDPESCLTGHFVREGDDVEGMSDLFIPNNTGGREVDALFTVKVSQTLDHLINDLHSTAETIILNFFFYVFSGRSVLEAYSASVKITDARIPYSVGTEKYVPASADSDAYYKDTREAGYFHVSNLDLSMHEDPADRQHGLEFTFASDSLALYLRDTQKLSVSEGEEPFSVSVSNYFVGFDNMDLVLRLGSVDTSMDVSFDSASLTYSGAVGEASISAAHVECSFAVPGGSLLEALDSAVLGLIDPVGFLSVLSHCYVYISVEDAVVRNLHDYTEPDGTRIYVEVVMDFGGKNEFNIFTDSESASFYVDIPSFETYANVLDEESSCFYHHHATADGLYFGTGVTSDENLFDAVIEMISAGRTEKASVNDAYLEVSGDIEVYSRGYHIPEDTLASFDPSEGTEGVAFSFITDTSVSLEGIDADFTYGGFWVGSDRMCVSFSASAGPVLMSRYSAELCRSVIELDVGDVIELLKAEEYSVLTLMDAVGKGLEISLSADFDYLAVDVFKLSQRPIDLHAEIGDPDASGRDYVSVRTVLALSGNAQSVTSEGTGINVTSKGDRFLEMTLNSADGTRRYSVSGMSAAVPIDVDLVKAATVLYEVYSGASTILEGTSPSVLETVRTYIGVFAGICSAYDGTEPVFTVADGSFIRAGCVSVTDADTSGRGIRYSVYGLDAQFEDVPLKALLSFAASPGYVPQGAFGYERYSVSPCGTDPSGSGNIPAGSIESYISILAGAPSSTLDVASNGVTVALTSEALYRIAGNGDGSFRNLSLSADVSYSIPESAARLIPSQKADSVAAVLSVTFDGAAALSDLGEISVTVPMPEGFSASEGYSVYYLSDDGSLTQMPTVFTVNPDGSVSATFTTSHFSLYVVMKDSPSEPEAGISVPVAAAGAVALAAGAVYFALLIRRSR